MSLWHKMCKQSLINISTGGLILIPLAKNIKRFFSLREIVIVLIGVIFSVSAGLGAFLYLKKDVVIEDNGKHLELKTMKNTVKETLVQNNISVSSYDYISMPLESELQKMKLNEIIIKRAVPINVLADGKTFRLMTYMDTVKEALAVSPVKPEGLDKLSGVQLNDSIEADMSIKIIRVKEETVTEQEKIPFSVVKRVNARLDKGVERVAKQGEEGVREKQYKIVTEDGKETEKKLVKDVVALSPVSMILEFGSVLNHKTARGDTIRYKKVLDMKASAYTASYEETGKRPGDPGYGITSSGIRVKKGVIAVDPRVIPIGTRVYIEVAGKTPDYGYAVAADTGSGIKNNRIDLYVDDYQDALDFGIKKCKVYILLND
jgi:Uncharacterized protein conserved in bacteria